jgi:predicted N-acetyltransferase YhbS
MPASDIHFRNATPADAEAMLPVLEAFGAIPALSSEWQHKRDELRRTAAQWRIGVEGTRVVCAAKAARSAIWFGGCRIPWADVGEVSVLPGLQGAGYGSAMMRDVTAHLAADGCAVARLGGLVRFYERFGYERFPRTYVEFPVRRSIRAGASSRPFLDTLTPRLGGSGRVRLIDPSRDPPALWEHVERFNRGRTGCRVWSRPDDASGLDGMLVYEEAGAALGMMVFRVFDEDFSPQEAKVTIYELAYEPTRPEALEALVKHALRVAYDADASRVTAFLPPDAAMVADLERLGLDYNLCQARGSVASNMVNVVSSRALLTAIAPELSARVRDVPWEGRIALDIGTERLCLEVTPTGVRVDAEGDAGTTLRLTHAELVRTVLGVMPPVWPDRVLPDHPAFPTLAAMFPPRSGGYTS